MKLNFKNYHIDKDRLPKELIIRGFSYAFLILLLSFLILFIIPIQNKIEGPVTIYSAGLPYIVKTITNGPLHIQNTEGKYLNKGEIVATQIWNINQEKLDLLETLGTFQLTDRHKTIDSLNILVQKISLLDIDDLKGHLQSIISSITQYKIQNSASQPDQITRGIEQELQRREATLNQLESIDKYFQNNNNYLKEQLVADSILYAEGAISLRDYDNRKIEWLETREKLLLNQSDKERVKNEMAELVSTNHRVQSDYLKLKAQNLIRINEQLDLFKKSYYELVEKRIIVAPANGTLKYNEILNSGIEYASGVAFAELIQDQSKSDQEELIYITTPISRSGEIKSDQKVFIELTEFVPHEYGFLEGTVIKKEITPNGESYRVFLKLNNGYVTSRGIEIPAQIVYTGNGEIIINKESIAEKIKQELYNRTEKFTR